MGIETMKIIEDTTEMIMVDKVLHIIEEDVEDIMAMDLMIMIKITDMITAMTMKGKVNGMEEEMVRKGKVDILKKMVNLVMEVGREDAEEGTMEGVEAVADQMTEGSKVEEAVGDFKGEFPWHLTVYLIL